MFLFQISEDLEKVKQEMEEKGSSMSDGGDGCCDRFVFSDMQLNFILTNRPVFAHQLRWWRSSRVWRSWSRRSFRWTWGSAWWSTRCCRPNSKRSPTWRATCTPPWSPSRPPPSSRLIMSSHTWAETKTLLLFLLVPNSTQRNDVEP